MDDSDLSGLDLAGAKELIFAYAVDIKRYDRELALTKAELELWVGRARLAEERSLADLATAARAKVEAANVKLQTLQSEQDELKAKVGRMRSQLPLIRAKERSIDPDRLLAELQLMTGELLGPDAGAGSSVERDIAALEKESAASSALDNLKKKMGQTGGSGGGPDSGA
ncbi:MAG TPA: hypothetical protein VMC79_11555 [Rectinemataceae bacterium]|nr:hypothetical protein [Rectinemataceae bacterium]